MGITPAPKKDRTDQEADKLAEAIIGKAPDAPAVAPEKEKKPRKPKVKREKTQISLTIEPSLLKQIDDYAAGLGLSRAAAFTMAVMRLLQDEKSRM